MASGFIRLSLALIVFAHHLSSIGIGKLCVFVFFALSGFWVARMWDQKYNKRMHTTRTFLVGRYLRIWPLFFIINIGATALEYSTGRRTAAPCNELTAIECTREIFSNLFLLGYTYQTHHSLPPAWSLDIELQFYLIFPLLALMQQKLGIKLLGIATVLLAVASTLSPVILLTTYLPFFVLGMAWAAHTRPIYGKTSVLMGICALGLVIAGFASDFGRQIFITGATPGRLAEYNEAANYLVALLIVPIVLNRAVLDADTFGRQRSISNTLSDLAFTIYLTHWLAVILISEVWGSLPARERLPYVAMVGIATLALSLFVQRHFIAPLERYRKQIISGPNDGVHRSDTTADLSGGRDCRNDP